MTCPLVELECRGNMIKTKPIQNTEPKLSRACHINGRGMKNTCPSKN